MQLNSKLPAKDIYSYLEVEYNGEVYKFKRTAMSSVSSLHRDKSVGTLAHQNLTYAFVVYDLISVEDKIIKECKFYNL